MRRQPNMKEIKPSPYRKAIRFFSFCNHLTYGSTDSVIADTILMHIRNVDRITLEGIADESNISLSSVSRFFTKCGFDGIQDFKLSLSEYLNAGGKMRTRSFLKEYAGMEYSDLSRSMKERGENSLNATYMQTDIEKLQDIVRIFKREQNVMIAGDTRELACFNLFQLDLACQGISALFKNINDISGSFAGYLRNEKCALCLISVYKGWYTEEIRTLANQAKQYHHPVILFTQDEAVASDDMDLVFTYGIPGSINDGYYSLHYLADMMSAMLYLEE